MISPSLQELVGSLIDPAKGIIPPKGVHVLHYGPDGSRVATYGQAQYSAHSSGGLSVSYSARRAGGAPYAESQFSIDAQGRPQRSCTRMLTLDGTVSQVITGEYGGLLLTTVGTPANGVAKFSAADAEGRVTHSAEMRYVDESYDSYGLSMLADDGQPSERTTISYAKAQIVGTRLVGGVLDITRKDVQDQLISSAQSFLTPQGVPYRMLGARYDKDGMTVNGYLDFDYSRVAFDALQAIDSGALIVRASDVGGQPQSAVMLRFRGGRLVGRAALAPGEGLPMAKPAPTPASVTPWSPPRPADRCTLNRRPDGTLLQKREDWFIQPGHIGIPRRSLVTLFGRDGSYITRITDVDYAGTHFGSNGSTIGGTIVSTRYQAGVRSSTTWVSY